MMISNAELTSTKEYERPSLSEEDGQSQPFLRQNATGPQLRPRKNEKRLYLSIFACVGLIYTIIWMSIAWYAAEYITSYKSAISKLQRYSPILKEVDMSLHTTIFNGSLFKINEYRQDGGPDSPVDDAWEALGVNYRALAIPESEAIKSGLEWDQVRINKKYGGGLPANVEGLHQLHCLNLVRKSLWFNYDYYHSLGKGAFVNDDYVVKAHVTHCLDIVRQQLMCTVDTAVLGQVWWNPEDPHAFVHFNTKHQCRNYEGVRKWARVRQLPEDVPWDYLEPPLEGARIYKDIP